jgi:hypothetical protein
VNIVAWHLSYKVPAYPVPVMGDTVVTVITGLPDWEAFVDFLLTNTLVSGDVTTPDTVTAKLGYTSSTTIDLWSGDAEIIGYKIDDPIDGPASGRAHLRGNGTLSFVAA